MKYFLFIFASSLVLSACTEDFFSQTVEIDPPAYDKQLSFHLDLSQEDSVVSVTMTRNYGILENVNNYPDWFVSGVNADIYENGQKWVTLLPASIDSAYVLKAALPHPFQEGSTYEIRAEHPNFPNLRSTQLVPNNFQVDSVRIRFDAVPGEYGDRLSLLEVYLQDQGNVKNYYEVSILTRAYLIQYDINGGMDTIGIQEYPVYVEGYNDPSVVEGYNTTGLVGDQFFDGQDYKFQARFQANYYNTVDSTYFIRVRSVTEDYFKWSRSYEAKSNSEDNPLVEPISVFSNLENGLGIFSIAQEKVYSVKK